MLSKLFQSLHHFLFSIIASFILFPRAIHSTWLTYLLTKTKTFVTKQPIGLSLHTMHFTSYYDVSLVFQISIHEQEVNH